MTFPPRPSRFLVLAAALCLAAPALAGPFDVPKELEGVDIIEHLDVKLPLDATFTDDHGKTVRLGDYFTGDKPVILTLNYYGCQGLCTMTLTGMVDALKQIEWSAGGEFDLITLSFDPGEPWQLGAAKKEAYLVPYERESAKAGWHFLVGDEANIKAVTNAVGFGYRYVPETGEWSHAAAVLAVTPDGRVSRYIYGIGLDYKPKDMRLALIEAGEGKVGSAFDRFILWCHTYDPNSRGYVRHALNLMRLGGALTLVTMAFGLFVLWRVGPTRRNPGRAAAASVPQSGPPVAFGG